MLNAPPRESGHTKGRADALLTDQRFEELFRRHYGDVLAYARRRLRNQALAEDAAAQTFAVAWRRLDQAPVDELPWLFGIARRVLLNELRTGRRQARLVQRLSAERRTGPTDLPDTAPRHLLVALRRLSERDREVLLLTAWEGLDPERAAAAVGCSRNTFAVRLHRARKRLRQELEANARQEMR